MTSGPWAKSTAALAVVVGCLALSGCAASLPTTVSSQLDEQTGTTHTWISEPLLFVHDTPEFGSFSRSFISVGLIEANRSGLVEYFLRAAAWRTDQFADYSSDVSSLESLILVVDGAPVSLEIHGWGAADIHAASDIYTRPFSRSAEAFYRIAPLQLKVLAQGTEIELLTTNSEGGRYWLWGDVQEVHQELQDFYSLAAH